MNVTIYHNPLCSKSRATLELLRARGIEPTIVEYLQTPPTRDQLKTILGFLGIRAIDLARRKDAAWIEAGLNDDSNDDAILDAMVDHPVIIERPIVVSAGRAAIGRPPESVNALFD
ncbi:MAG: arsenate reductase (glutaredoxin) [Gammaproteobacteria bacterium]|nr:arsenate reductase (glutaredoxin) [Gammaproteobacteria bacterium]